MEKLKKWRFHLREREDFVLTGVDRYGREVHIPVQQDNIQYVHLIYKLILRIGWKDICSGLKMQICLRLSHRCEQSNDSQSNPPSMQFTA